MNKAKRGQGWVVALLVIAISLNACQQSSQGAKRNPPSGPDGGCPTIFQDFFKAIECFFNPPTAQQQ